MRGLLLAALGAVSVAAPASAAQYCVGSTGTACGGGSYAFTAAGLTSAIAAAKAAANADEVRIAAGTLAAVPALTIDDTAGLLVVGAGGERTTLQVNAGAGAAVTVTSGKTDLTGLRVSGVGSTGLRVSESGFLTRASVFEALHIDGYSRGIELASTGLPGPTITDSLIDLGNNTLGRGILAASTVALFSATRLTIVGRGTAQVGVDVEAGASQFDGGTITDSLIYLPGGGATISLKCVDAGGTNSGGSLDVQRTSFYPSAQFTSADDGCSAGAEPTSIVSALDAQFVNPSAGDYRLQYFSAAIDRGDAARPDETTDLEGGSRYVDGNADGTTAVDLGAFEYQRRAPNVPTITASDTAVAPGAAVKFTSTNTDPDPGDFDQISWDFGDGTTSDSFLPTHAFAALGTFTVTATVTDPTGLTNQASVAITVANPPGLTDPTPTPKPGPGGSALDALTALHAKVLTAPTKSVKRGSGGFSTQPAAAPDLATLEVGGATTLRVSLTQLVPGRKTKKKGAKCKAGAKRGTKCTARVAVKAIGQVPVAPGTVYLKFGGKLGGKKLPAGTYEVSVVPVAVSKARGTAAIYTLKLR